MDFCYSLSTTICYPLASPEMSPSKAPYLSFIVKIIFVVVFQNDVLLRLFTINFSRRNISLAQVFPFQKAWYIKIYLFDSLCKICVCPFQKAC